jgi:hypothetical protein
MNNQMKIIYKKAVMDGSDVFFRLLPGGPGKNYE